MMFDTITTALPHVKSGKLRALAVTSATRSPLAPEVPTMIESGLPGFDISAWYVMFAPANMPKDVMQRLNAEVNKAIADPELRKSLGDQGVSSPAARPRTRTRSCTARSTAGARSSRRRGMSAN